MRYKCIKEMCLPKCDGDGFEIPNEYGIVTAGSIWERDDRASIIGGDVRLESADDNDEFGWIEITVDDLKENFVEGNMERLTSYKNECKREMICNHEECFMDEEHCPHVNEDICPCLQEVLEKLAEYEDLEERRKLPCNWVSEETPPETPCYVLLSFDNFSMPLIGRWEENEEGGAFYIGDDEESCISQDLIVNGWMPLPEPYREDEREELKQGYPEEKAGADALDAGMAADITQAIEYFEDELSQMKVFAEMVTFREEEKKSVETALKVLRGITENGKGQQGNQCATSHR